MSAVAALSVLCLFLFIGACQAIWLKSSIAAFLKQPIDGGLKLFGARIFGPNKTIRGFVLIIPIATIVFFIFGSCLSSRWLAWELTPGQWALAGFCVGWGYMIGELPNSFCKRQLGIPEGQRASRPWQRRLFNLLDESDSIIGALIGGALILPIDSTFVGIVLPSGALLHWGFNRLVMQRRRWPAVQSVGIYFLSFLLLSISLVLTWPLAALFPRLHPMLIQKFTRIGLWFLGIRYTVKTGISLDTGILLCNHSSWLDQLLLIAIAPKPLLFIAHAKYFRVPLLGWVLRCQGSLPKPGNITEARLVQKSVLQAVNQGRLVIVFPEGTRSEQGFPLPWVGNLRHLPRHVSWEAAWISGAADCLPRGMSLWKIRRGHLQFHRLARAGVPGPELRKAWVEQWILDRLVPLHEARDPFIFGGKAAQLAGSWTRHRIPVGFVLASEVADRLRDPREPDFSERLDQAIDHWFSQQKAGKTWVVRSSAIGEDGEQHSFAGQLESVLHVKSAEDMKEAIRKVYASQARASVYETITLQKLQGCAVILQEQVDAHFAGVAFSRFVQDQNADFVIEYTAGLGEDLVQGRVNPSRATLCRRSGAIKSEDHKVSMLSPELLLQIFQMGMSLEKSRGHSVDVEWAIDSQGVLFLLQVRAITCEGGLEKFLSNANMNENYPKPVTPFLFSFAARGYQQYFTLLGTWTGVPRKTLVAAEPALKNILGIHKGRLYYDLTAVRECLGHLPFSKKLIHFWDEFLGIGVVDLPNRPKSMQPWQFLFPLRFLLRLSFLMLVFPRLSHRFHKRVQTALHERTPGDSLTVRRHRLGTICHIRFQAWGEAALCDAAVMIYSGFLRSLLMKAVGSESVPYWHSRLLSGTAAISTQQLNDLRLLQRNCQAFPDLYQLLQKEEWTKAWTHITQAAQYKRVQIGVDQWLERWGTRVSGELMLTEENYFDQPHLLLKLLSSPIAEPGFAKSQGSQRILLHESRSFLWSGLALGIAIPARAAVRAREVCRLAQSQLYGALRANLLGIGRIGQVRGLLTRVDDPFFLTLDELQEFLREGSYSLGVTRQTVELRRQKYLAYQDRRVAERIGRRTGRPWFSRESLASALPVTLDPQGAWQQRFGYPASSGFVKGRIRILRSTEECHKLKAGEILVTRETDPGWIVAMGRAAALVVERGGMLSHGAIVARELGIPAVIGLQDITEHLQDGMEIEVDGQRGMIRWTNSAPSFVGEASASLSGTTGLLQ